MEGTKNRVKIPFFIIITYILNLYIGFNYASLQFTLLEMKTEFQISSTLMATITSVQLVTGLLMTFVFSKILDHLDVKKTLLTGFAISIIGTLIAGFSNGPAMTTVSNIVSSIGSNIMMAAPYPILMLLDPTRVTLHVNRQQGLLSLGSVIAPLVMAVLMNILGLSWRVGYFIGAGILVVLFLLVLNIKSPGKSTDLAKEEQESEEEKKNRKRIIWTPAFICMGLILALYMFMESGVLNYAKDYFQVGLNDALGASLCISVVRGGMTISRFLADKITKNRVTHVWVSLLGSMLSLILIGLITVPKVSLAWFFLFGLFGGPCWPIAMSMGLSLDEKSSGKLSSILMLYNNIGNNIGNIANGFFVDHIGVSRGYLIDAFYGILGLLALIIGVRSFRRLGISAEGDEYEAERETAKTGLVPRGNRYKRNDVDRYISDMKASMSSVETELKDLKEENARYQQQKDQIVGALISAQLKSKEIVEEANKKASDTLEAAEKEKEAHLEEMRQKDILLNEEYENKKRDLAKNVDALVNIREGFRETIEKDLMGFLAKMNDMGSTQFLEQLSEEQKQKLELLKKVSSKTATDSDDDSAEWKRAEETAQKYGIDLPLDDKLKDILKDLM